MPGTFSESLRSEVGAFISAVILIGAPLAAYVGWLILRLSSPTPTGGTILWGAVCMLTVILVALLVVARWFKRLGTNSDIDELRKAAFSYKLGGALALRPFLTGNGPELTPDSSIADYEQGVHEPQFLRTPSLPNFLLAVLITVCMGLLSFAAAHLDLAGEPNLLLSGPFAADPNMLARTGQGGAGANLALLIAYQQGALTCVAFAFLGALLWSLTSLVRRMAQRDVTGHAFQTVAVRLVGAAIVALFAYHLKLLIMPWGGLDRASWDDAAVILIAFGAGVIPEVALRWMMGWTRRMFGAKRENRSDDLELEMLEGIDAYTRVRLAEAGIYDAQGLANANPLRLTMQTPFSLPQIVDWAGQALLLIQLKQARYDASRDHGLRTAWQLAALAEAPFLLEGAAAGKDGQQAAPLSTDEARQTLALLQADAAFVRGLEISQRMRLKNEPDHLIGQQER